MAASGDYHSSLCVAVLNNWSEAILLLSLIDNVAKVFGSSSSKDSRPKGASALVLINVALGLDASTASRSLFVNVVSGCS